MIARDVRALIPAHIWAYAFRVSMAIYEKARPDKAAAALAAVLLTLAQGPSRPAI